MTHSCSADANILTHFQLEKHNGASGTQPDALRFTSLRFVNLPTGCLEGASPIASQSPSGPARPPSIVISSDCIHLMEK